MKKLFLIFVLLLVFLTGCSLNNKTSENTSEEGTTKKKEYLSKFDEDSWETISKNIKSGNTSEYKVGDLKTIDIDFDGDGTKETHTLRILNMSTPDECKKANFSQSACGFVVDFVDSIGRYQMNDNDDISNKGWKNTKLRSLLNSEIYNKLPENLKNVIIDTKVVTIVGNNKFDETTDKLYLLSLNEFKYENKTYTRKLDYSFDSNKNPLHTEEKACVRYSVNTDHYADWWTIDLVEPTSSYSSKYAIINASCYILFGGTYPTSKGDVAPVFRIG